MKRARLEVRLTEDDKEFLKALAFRQSTTVTKLIEEFIRVKLIQLRTADSITDV